MLVKKFVKTGFIKKYFDGNDDGQGDGQGDGQKPGEQKPGDGKGNPPPKAGDPPKTFTQEQLDRIVEQRLARQKVHHDKTLAQLQELETNQNLTQQERDALKTQIDEMKTAYMTKEELAAQERKKLETVHLTEKQKLTQEAETWKSRFTTSTISRAILDSAVSSEAVVPKLLVDILSSKTRLVEEKDADGKPTGNLVPYAKFDSLDKDGKPVVFDLPVPEAVKQMKETPAMYGSLFKSGTTGGVGGNNTHPGNTNRGTPSNMDEYLAQRKNILANQGA